MKGEEEKDKEGKERRKREKELLQGILSLRSSNGYVVLRLFLDFGWVEKDAHLGGVRCEQRDTGRGSVNVYV